MVGLLLAVGLADRFVHIDDPNVATGPFGRDCRRFHRGRLASRPRPPHFVPLGPGACPADRGAFSRLRGAARQRLAFQTAGCSASFGSRELQERVIAETDERAGRLDFREVVQFSYVRPSLLVAAMALLAAAGLAWHSPRATAIAA